LPKRSIVGSIVFFLVLSVAPSSWALRPYLTTENAVPVDRGESRLELGLLRDQFDNSTVGYAFLGELTYGVINNLDFAIEFPYRFLRSSKIPDDEGLGDVKIKTKLRFIKGREANPLSIAGQFVVKFPTCDEEKRLSIECTGEPDVGWVVMASKEFFPVTVHLNMGYLLVGNPPGQHLEDIFSYSLAFDLQTKHEPLRIVSELSGQNNQQTIGNPNEDTDTLSALFGLIYAIDLDKTLDLGVGLGLTKNAPDYHLTLGVTYQF
jgi:hypothetical protein